MATTRLPDLEKVVLHFEDDKDKERFVENGTETQVESLVEGDKLWIRWHTHDSTGSGGPLMNSCARYGCPCVQYSDMVGKRSGSLDV